MYPQLSMLLLLKHPLQTKSSPLSPVLIAAHPPLGCAENRLAADGLDMLTDLVDEGSHAAKGIWQDTAAAAGRLHEQVDQTLPVSALKIQ
jgi:hypothetical protein